MRQAFCSLYFSYLQLQQEFLLSSSNLVYEATWRMSQFDRVVVEVPAEWGGGQGGGDDDKTSSDSELMY